MTKLEKRLLSILLQQYNDKLMTDELLGLDDNEELQDLLNELIDTVELIDETVFNDFLNVKIDEKDVINYLRNLI